MAARPLRLVFATVGSRGDVQPMLALALHAQARGHHVTLAAPPDFGDGVRGRGVAFQELGRDMQSFLASHPEVMTGNSRQMLRVVERYFAEEVPRQVRQLVPVAQVSDAVVWAGLAGSAVTVAEKLRIPAIGILYTSSVLPSGDHPPPSMPLYGAPRWVNRLLWAIDRRVGERAFGTPLHAVRAELGLPRRSVREQLFDNSDFILAADEGLFPLPSDWSRPITRSTSIFLDDPRELDADLLAWLDAGEPPVFAGFGSMSGPGPQRAARAFVEALAAGGRRGLVGSGWAGVGADLPTGWRRVGDVPHAKLFPRLAAVVHHGGAGTTAAALRAGVPQVVLPLFLDQHHHGHAVHRAGLGPKPMRMERVTAPQLRAMVETALRVPTAALQAAARRLAQRDARAEIVDAIERRAG
ncbi:glycosyltransferase [Ramlibacter algicola]|uniref:Glycosyltransferase family 1 protein n=1 Tax=Ramlibacter algicola TaxID=2795217 RepID=A0A934Q390_9BURK|nr:glycosyltransferase [Ramlibacter algicola]MBK0394038.1 glycosyltransferase family 1 protein [Ramlibacter algicola]